MDQPDEAARQAWVTSLQAQARVARARMRYDEQQLAAIRSQLQQVEDAMAAQSAVASAQAADKARQLAERLRFSVLCCNWRVWVAYLLVLASLAVLAVHVWIWRVDPDLGQALGMGIFVVQVALISFAGLALSDAAARYPPGVFWRAWCGWTIKHLF